MPRTKLERVVRVIDTDELMAAFAARIAEGYLYGDCQFSTDTPSDTYLKQGRVRLLSTAAAGHADAGGAEGARRGALARALLPVARRHPARLRDLRAYYLSTSGQRYWSDTSQLSLYSTIITPSSTAGSQAKARARR